MSTPPPEVLRQIAPGGTLRVALNLANPMLASGTADAPVGVTVDLSRALGRKLGIDVAFQPLDAAGKVVDTLKSGACDIAYMAIDPSRAADFIFSPAYMLIEAAYAVRADSGFKTPADADRKGVRIASADGAAYTQYLSRTLTAATLVPSKDAFVDFRDGRADIAAGIRQSIAALVGSEHGLRMIPDRFMEIPQGISVLHGKDAAAAFVRAFVEDAKASGFVASSLASHGYADAVVAPLAS